MTKRLATERSQQRNRWRFALPPTQAFRSRTHLVPLGAFQDYRLRISD